MAVDSNIDLEHPGVVQSHPREKRKPDYHKLVPLIYAPALPLLRLGLNNRVSASSRDKIFAAAVFTALFHAGYVMSGDSSM